MDLVINKGQFDAYIQVPVNTSQEVTRKANHHSLSLEVLGIRFILLLHWPIKLYSWIYMYLFAFLSIANTEHYSRERGGLWKILDLIIITAPFTPTAVKVVSAEKKW